MPQQWSSVNRAINSPRLPACHDTLGTSLTHWGWDKMDVVSQTTLWNAFSWMKMLEFRLKFHWSLFLNIPALVQIMAWRRPGDKPLSEPMMVVLPMHICVTRPPWVNTLRPRQNGCHMADNILTLIFWKKIATFLLKSHWILFPRVELTMNQLWFRYWLGTKLAASNYLKHVGLI